MNYDYTIIRRATVALQNLIADLQTVNAPTVDLSGILAGIPVDGLNLEGDEVENPERIAPNPFPAPIANPVYKNEQGSRVMAARRGEAMKAITESRADIVAMCQERADLHQEPTAEMRELFACLGCVIDAIAADPWNMNWSRDCKRGVNGSYIVEDLGSECQELAAAMALRLPLQESPREPREAAFKPREGECTTARSRGSKRGGNTAPGLGVIRIDRERLAAYFTPRFKGMNDAKIDYFKAFCDVLERDAVGYSRKNLAQVAYWVGRSEYLNKTTPIMSFPRWLAAFFKLCGCECLSDKSVSRYRSQEGIEGVLSYLGKFKDEPQQWKR